jgi:hypothetical protein
MDRIEVSTGHGSEILLKVESDIITLTLHIVQLLVSYSFYKIKIKFAANHIVTKILTFACWVVVHVAKGYTHRAAQCVSMCRIAVSSRLGCQVMIRKA